MVKTFNLEKHKEEKLLKKIEKLGKELTKEHKNEKQEKRKTKKAFEELIKKIMAFEKKKSLTAEESAVLVSLIEKVQGEVVE